MHVRSLLGYVTGNVYRAGWLLSLDGKYPVSWLWCMYEALDGQRYCAYVRR
jgi:hypothetical protein